MAQIHERFMKAALREALRWTGCTSPNPVVGAVIVKGGRILARGAHERAGDPHAEVMALGALPAGQDARGATLYVTLEPCCTYGRTPPCTEAIINAGFARVVIGVLDPNPLHAGRAVRILQERGVDVVVGALQGECAAANRAFFKWVTTGTPWVIAKAGMSLDGRMTRPPGEGQWITGPAARRDAHRLRVHVDAILVGANTLRADNPRLTIRGVGVPAGKAQPWRVVLSRGNSVIPLGAHLFTDEHRDRTLVYAGKSLAEVLCDLGSRGVCSLLVEGGGETLGAFFDAGLVDEVCFYMAPLICGGTHSAVGGLGAAGTESAWKIADPSYQKVGRDLKLTGLVRRGEPPRSNGQ
jgi:diaminohydroxyphosphoribosylaminopyrimidine deaminase/5-amino-6-(5-phosphoribosylamino)uracil reductase